MEMHGGTRYGAVVAVTLALTLLGSAHGPAALKGPAYLEGGPPIESESPYRPISSSGVSVLRSAGLTVGS